MKIRSKTIDRNLENNSHAIVRFLDRISFLKIFFAWIFIILIFGVAYWSLSVFIPSHGIVGEESLDLSFTGFLNGIYYSFVTATTTGYGDFFPLGFSRFFSALEAIVGYLILGVVISKLVSVKQNSILDELYHISYEEVIERLRSQLYLYRADIRQEILSIEGGRFKQKDVKDVLTIFSGINNIFDDIRNYIKPKNNPYGKRIDSFKLELLLNSIRLSFNKISELLTALEESKFKWKTESVLTSVELLILSYKEIGQESYKLFSEKKIEEKLTLIDDSVVEIKKLLD
jgi:hypothetical protein